MAPAPSASISTTASPNPSSGGQRRGPLAADSAPRTGPKGAPSITTPPWLLRTAQSSATGWWASPKGIRRFRSALWDCMVLLVSLSLWFWFYSYWIRVFSGLQRIWDWNWSSLLVCLGGEFSLHYTTVALGMPSQTYMVALDTGSDLFWVPCDCISCAPTSSASYGFVSFSCFLVWLLIFCCLHLLSCYL